MLQMNRTASKRKFLSDHALRLRNSRVGGFTMKGISIGVITLLCFVLIGSLQSAEPWKPLFNGKDFTGWTAAARVRGSSMSPTDAGWEIENSVIVGGHAGPGQRGGS